MAGPTKKPKKRRVEGSGRVTPKGGPTSSSGASKRRNTDSDETTGSGSSRYTPPSVRPQDLPSPPWVPALMFSLFGLGMLTIFLNYVELLPYAVTNWYLLLGLGFILGGIITATQYR